MENRKPGYGTFPREKISHMVTPNAQTSEWLENIRSVSDSSAIHLTGSIAYFNTNKI